MDTRIIEALKNVLHRDNILAKTFRMASHTFKECDYHNAILKLTNKCGADGKRHGMPSATEVAALIVNGTVPLHGPSTAAPQTTVLHDFG
uniref:Uncharacterized protein n=1 Tax=Aegilops tauschii subsp. strangulata TaxID=200361 RepID=A0A453NXZ9_AEGTS